MKPFHFRAARVLDLRKREEDDARVVFGRANAVQHAAATRLTSVQEAAEEGRAKCLEVYEIGAPAWLVGWHQSWMTKQRLDVSARTRELAAATERVAAATAALRIAHRKRRVLERLRDRAWRRYQVEAARDEAREMNLLAGLRYLAQAADTEGALREHE